MNANRLWMLLILTLILASGCATTARRVAGSSAPSAPSDPSEEGRLITTFGEHRIGNTIVEANQSEGKLTVKHLTSKEYDGGKSNSSSAMSTPPNEWPLQDGWFAYARKDGVYVWLYNGADKMLIVERKETPERNFTNIYGPNNSPVPIPSPVLKNVKEHYRAKLVRKT